MPIPQFNDKGNLPKGIISCDGKAFIDRFCKSDNRQLFKKAITDILDFSIQTNAHSVFFGGSFVTNTLNPNDIDCLIVYEKDEYVPSTSDRVKYENIRLDIMFASMEHMHYVHAYISLFSKNKVGAEVGVIQINMFDKKNKWKIVNPGLEEYEIIKRAYCDRYIEEINDHKGILVTIHGLLSHGDWYKELAHISSSQGWIFAPYYYGFQNPTILLNKKKKKKIVNDFRNFIYTIQTSYRKPISIIAHSFGTYILASYLVGFEKHPVKFNCVILTGSIINSSFNWDKYLSFNVSKVLHEKAPEDQWVKLMTNKCFENDDLFGNSCVTGFEYKDEQRLIESTNCIFDHNNVIKQDIIKKSWMPFLDANRYSNWEDLTETFK